MQATIEGEQEFVKAVMQGLIDLAEGREVSLKQVKNASASKRQ